MSVCVRVRVCVCVCVFSQTFGIDTAKWITEVWAEPELLDHYIYAIPLLGYLLICLSNHVPFCIHVNLEFPLFLLHVHCLATPKFSMANLKNNWL